MAEANIPQQRPENPDPLGRLTDQLFRTLSDLIAEVIGRASSQSASVSVSLYEEVAHIRRDVAAIKRIVEELKHSDRLRTARYDELQRTVNGQFDGVHAEVDGLRAEVEKLKERQAGDGG